MKKQLFNPYLPSWEYVPDGEPHVFGNRLYLYGSHDKFGGKAYCENDYVCWSAPVDDLSDWTFHGTSYRRAQDPDWGKNHPVMNAPDVAKGLDGRYYLYYQLQLQSRIKVAVSNKPEGPYEYVGAVRYSDGTDYGAKKQDRYLFDPGVLVDDDDSVWLYTGFCPKSKVLQLLGTLTGGKTDARGSLVVKLDRDMRTIISEPKLLIPGADASKGTGFEGHEFYEASSMRKFNGKYYAIYSSVLSHELVHAISDYPDRGFRYAGTLHSNGNIGYKGVQTTQYYWGNNHGAVACVNGRYYIFGHRQTNGTEYSRQGVAEELTMKPDGSFEMAEMTSCGLNGGPLESEGRYEAGIACVLYGAKGACKTTLSKKEKKNHPYITQDGEDRQADPGQYIANIRDKTVIGYKYFKADTPTVTLIVKWTGKEADGVFEVYTDPLMRELSGAIRISGNGDEAKSEISVPEEKYPLFLRYQGTGVIELREIGFDNKKRGGKENA